MSSIVELRAFKQRQNATLVLVDLHRAIVEKTSSTQGDRNTLAAAIANCRVALEHARAWRMSVAFIRPYEGRSPQSGLGHYSRRLESFEPKRSDMVFDRRMPSCYASAEFVEMAGHVDGNYVLAGLFGETSCLSTAVDAFHRDHRFTYLADASASRGLNGIPSAAMHESVTTIISLYGTVLTTQSWIRATSQKLGVHG